MLKLEDRRLMEAEEAEVELDLRPVSLLRILLKADGFPCFLGSLTSGTFASSDNSMAGRTTLEDRSSTS